MTLAAKLASVFGYRVAPTSLLVFISYFFIFVALFATDILPSVPSPHKQGGLDLKGAYDDLRHITAHPHPYNSHANDDVRAYILSQLESLALNYSHVHISNDLVSNGSWASPLYGVYFEGTNILVKIDGTSPNSSNGGGVLFSAHYDSVSTAPGATDDGMGVTTLLQLVKYFAKNRHPRTAVFNINNGEEDWLNGAHAFLEHPWSKLADVFLNLEGAAAGGRPILFRATSTSPVRAFRNTKLVPHPHANVLSSDAFSRGFIRSGTDYSVYAGPGPRAGMAGLDLAFLGGKKSLWSMMEVAKGVGIGLLDKPFKAEEENVDDDERTKDAPVYFDVFKSFAVVFPLSKLLTFNIVTLIVGPIILIFLLVCERVILAPRNQSTEARPVFVRPSSSTSQRRSSEHPRLRYFGTSSFFSPRQEFPEPEAESAEPPPTSSSPRGIDWLHTIWRHAKFWVALFAAIGMQLLLTSIYISLNPFAIYSSPYIILFSMLSLGYLVLVYTLTLPSSLPFYHPKGPPLPFNSRLRPAQQQKHTIFFHLYAFTWILLVLATLGITRLHPGLGGGYLVSVWSACVGVGCLIAVLEGLVSSNKWRVRTTGYEELEGSGVANERESILPHRSHWHVDDADADAAVDVDERTPLVPRENEGHARRNGDVDVRGKAEEDVGPLSTWWWIPQFLVSVPIPVILFSHVSMLLLDAMPQTLADGASPWNVYFLACLLALFLILPLAPFAYKLRPYRPLTTLVWLTFIFTTLYALLAFPFSNDAPLKIYFQQRLQFEPIALNSAMTSMTHTNTHTNTIPTPGWPKVITSLTGPKRYLPSSLIPRLPSSQVDRKIVFCKDDESKAGLVTCEWESGPRMIPVPGLSVGDKNEDEDDVVGSGWKEGQFFKADVERTGESSAKIRVKGKNTRSCRVYFDSAPVYEYVVSPPGGGGGGDGRAGWKGMQKGYEVGSTGVTEVRLWSRTWGREFMLDVDWGNYTTSDSSSSFSSKKGSSAGAVIETALQGRIACEWAEYESGMVDHGTDLTLNLNGTQANSDGGEGVYIAMGPADADDGQRPKIPALEEVLTFLPEWAVVSKYADGLVEAWAPFSV